MTRKSTIWVIFSLVIAYTVTGAGSAQAFCIDNKTLHPLRVHQETHNPFGKFVQLFEPGTKSCCAWFSQRCNPTRTRDGMLMFTVRSQRNATTELYCASGWVRRLYATANGNIVITEKRGTLGGLECDSRDLYRRPVTLQTYRKHVKKSGLPPAIVVPPPPSD